MPAPPITRWQRLIQYPAFFIARFDRQLPALEGHAMTPSVTPTVNPRGLTLRVGRRTHEYDFTAHGREAAIFGDVTGPRGRRMLLRKRGS